MIVLVGKQRIFSSCHRVALPGDTGETLDRGAAPPFPPFPRLAAAGGAAGEVHAGSCEGGGGALAASPRPWGASGSGAAAPLGEAVAPSQPASFAGVLWPAASTTRVVRRRRVAAAARRSPLLVRSEGGSFPLSSSSPPLLACLPPSAGMMWVGDWWSGFGPRETVGRRGRPGSSDVPDAVSSLEVLQRPFPFPPLFLLPGESPKSGLDWAVTARCASCSSLGAPPGEGCVQVRGSRSELGWLGWSGDGGVTRFGMAVGVRLPGNASRWPVGSLDASAAFFSSCTWWFSCSSQAF